MGNHFNNLSPAEQEWVSLLLEEAGEVIQICGKILRHGFDSCNPDDPERKTNRQLLEKEIGHFDFAKLLMCGEEDLIIHHIEESALIKKLKVGKWLHHQDLD